MQIIYFSSLTQPEELIWGINEGLDSSIKLWFQTSFDDLLIPSGEESMHNSPLVWPAHDITIIQFLNCICFLFASWAAWSLARPEPFHPPLNYSATVCLLFQFCTTDQRQSISELGQEMRSPLSPYTHSIAMSSGQMIISFKKPSKGLEGNTFSLWGKKSILLK